MTTTEHRRFDARPAVRQSVNLNTGLVGASSSGKTYSALLLATGIQRVVGGDIYVIDTENRRATFYSEIFKFHHVQFDPPYGGEDYIKAIEHCEERGAKIIVVDSMSHEHEGEGGLIETHEAEVERLSRGNEAKRDAVKMLAWNKPKQARRKLLRHITTSNANFVLCFRAKHISKPIKERGETKVVDMGFVPIAGEEFVFEMQLCALLPPNSGGVPNWSPEYPGERMAVKLPVQFRQFITDGEPISAELGQRLAEWARGKPPKSIEELTKEGNEAAKQGSAALKTWWASLRGTGAQERLKDELPKFKIVAEESDEAREREPVEQ